jgi:hypothetical protein
MSKELRAKTPQERFPDAWQEFKGLTQFIPEDPKKYSGGNPIPDVSGLPKIEIKILGFQPEWTHRVKIKPWLDGQYDFIGFILSIVDYVGTPISLTSSKVLCAEFYSNLHPVTKGIGKTLAEYIPKALKVAEHACFKASTAKPKEKKPSKKMPQKPLPSPNSPSTQPKPPEEQLPQI